jgi:hypothetical protein
MREMRNMAAVWELKVRPLGPIGAEVQGVDLGESVARKSKQSTGRGIGTTYSFFEISS